MDDFRYLDPLRALFRMALAQIRLGDLADRVMADPGTGGYIAAYTRLLEGGIDMFEDEYDGRRLVESFDIQENLLLFHSNASESATDRWLSILASCIELYAWDGFEGPRAVSGSSVLLYLLEDSLAVHPEAPEALIQYNALCRQLRDTSNLHLRAAAITAELLSGEEAEDADAGALCDESAELQRSFADPYLEKDGEWVQNFRYCKDPVWEPLMGQRNDKKRWTTLMEARFPKQPGRAASMRALFLVHPMG